VFGRASDRPFEPWTVTERARRAWSAAGLTPITLHECRHTYASLMIAAGVNPKALQTFMGHASITITMDRYGSCSRAPKIALPSCSDAYLEQAHVLVTHPVHPVRGNAGKWNAVLAGSQRPAAASPFVNITNPTSGEEPGKWRFSCGAERRRNRTYPPTGYAG